MVSTYTSAVQIPYTLSNTYTNTPGPGEGHISKIVYLPNRKRPGSTKVEVFLKIWTLTPGNTSIVFVPSHTTDLLPFHVLEVSTTSLLKYKNKNNTIRNKMYLKYQR